MERYLMFMDWKPSYEGSNATQSNIQIQCNPYQNPSGLFFFSRSGKADLRIYKLLQEMPNSQNSVEKEEQNRKQAQSKDVIG